MTIPRHREADAAVAAFVASRPEYAVDAVQQAYRGGTNVVTFGTRGREPVVFKYFFRPNRWRNESLCLGHYAASGLVPRVLDALPGSLLVLTRLPGHDVSLERLPQFCSITSCSLGLPAGDKTASYRPGSGIARCDLPTAKVEAELGHEDDDT